MTEEELQLIVNEGKLPRDFHNRILEYLEAAIEKNYNNSWLPGSIIREDWKEMFFSRTYANIMIHMLKRKLDIDVVDIGCNCGFQSEFFLKGNYVGVDMAPPHIGFSSGYTLGRPFFNESFSNIKYIMDYFPSKKINKIIKGRTLISSMALGYYNIMGANDNSKNGFTGDGTPIRFVKLSDETERNISFNILCDSLELAENIYARVPVSLSELLRERFSYFKEYPLPKDCGAGYSEQFICASKKPII